MKKLDESKVKWIISEKRKGAITKEMAQVMDISTAGSKSSGQDTMVNLASIMTDHGTQFYANASKIKKKGVSAFEKKLVELDIKHILARVRHPQTNGKLKTPPRRDTTQTA